MVRTGLLDNLDDLPLCDCFACPLDEARKPVERIALHQSARKVVKGGQSMEPAVDTRLAVADELFVGLLATGIE